MKPWNLKFKLSELLHYSTLDCVVLENIHTPTTEGIENSGGERDWMINLAYRCSSVLCVLQYYWLVYMSASIHVGDITGITQVAFKTIHYALLIH